MGKFNLDEFNTKKKDVKKTIDDNSSDKTSVVVKQKMPMMNIRFSPENYEYMRREAALRGLSVIAFTNWIIDEYRRDPEHVHDNPLYQNEENW